MVEVQSTKVPVARLDPTFPIRPGTLFAIGDVWVTAFSTPCDNGLISRTDLACALDLRAAEVQARGVPSAEIGEQRDFLRYLLCLELGSSPL